MYFDTSSFHQSHTLYFDLNLVVNIQLFNPIPKWHLYALVENSNSTDLNVLLIIIKKNLMNSLKNKCVNLISPNIYFNDLNKSFKLAG